LRIPAVARKGTVSGETLRRVDHPQKHLVIDTRQNAAAWNAWKTSPERAAIQMQIDAPLGALIGCEVYEHRYIEK
jgi:hypothetical protein